MTLFYIMIQTLKKYLLENQSFQILFILSGLLSLIVLEIFTYFIVYQNNTACYRETFPQGDGQFRQLIIFTSIIILISISVYFILYKLFCMINKYRYQEKVLLESIGDGVFATDKDFRIILWNKAACTITGLTPQEVIGQKCSDIFKFIHAKTHRDKSLLIAESIRQGKIQHRNSNILMVLNNGRKIPIGDSIAPVFGRNGQVDGAIVVFRDITREIDLDRAKDEFLSVTAHQLRTPLGVMRWNMELILKEKFGKITQETKTALEDMFSNNMNMIKLVNDLLDVSRINQNRITNKPQPVSILPILRKVIKERKNGIKAKKITLTISGVKERLPKIKVDPALFSQVLKNLLSNAIKYNHVKGSIVIEIIKKDRLLLITVKDSGIGIPKKQLEKVFEKFTRGDNAVSHGIAGTGLGLFVVKSYLDLWKGRIWLESIEGKGTTVYFTIPYKYEKNTRH